jgi:hypothetical protein
MRVNQNYSRELGLYPKIDPTSLPSNSARPYNYKKLSDLETRLGNLKIQRKTTIDVSKVTCETTATKNESKGS